MKRLTSFLAKIYNTQILRIVHIAYRYDQKFVLLQILLRKKGYPALVFLAGPFKPSFTMYLDFFFMYIHFFFRHGSVLHRAHRALMHRSTHNMTLGPTLYNVILSIARNFLETRENIKISTLPYKSGQILKGMKQKKWPPQKN